MRMAVTGLAMAAGILAASLATATSASAQWVPPFKGNDTGGIIAYGLASQTDIRAMAIDHCAGYGKVVKFLGVQPYEGGYISFACRWVPYGRVDRPLRAYY